MIKKQTCHQFFSFVLTLVIFVFGFWQTQALALENQKTVRIGYVSVKGYEEGGPGEYKTGFGYEYFQKISYYTGWKYQYSYGSFGELYNMLIRGEIDILGNVTPTAERRKKLLFSTYPQGSESFYVFAPSSRDDLIGQPVTALQGKRIGVGKDTFQSRLMDEYFAKHGVKVQKFEFNGTRGVVKALEDGEIDAGVMTNATDYGYAPVQLLGIQNYNFALSASRSDLLTELDHAMQQIQSAEPNYNMNVTQRYSFGSVAVHYLTKKEKKWLSEHNNTIHIGYLEDNLPYSATGRDGKLKGVLSVVTEQLEKKYGIRVRVTPYVTVVDALRAIEEGKVDAMGLVYGDFYLSEHLSKIQTEVVMSTTPVILYRDKIRTDRIAVFPGTIFDANVIKTVSPKSEILEYPSIEEGLSAIARGQADCTIVTSAKLNLLRQYPVMEQLRYAEQLRNADLCIILEQGQSLLMTILNKAIFLSRTQLRGAAFVTATDSSADMNWKQVFHEYFSEIVISALGIITIFLAIIINQIYLSKKAHSAQVHASESDKKLVEVSEDRDQLKKEVDINALTGLFNRKRFQQDSESLTDLSRIAVLSIDVNGLKYVNDTQGHHCGDELLVAAGSVIRSTFGAVARCYHISGDEFAVIQNNDLWGIQSRIVTLKQQCRSYHHPSFELSVSVGVAVGSEHPSLTFGALFELADKEMYHDKELYHCEHPEMMRKPDRSVMLQELPEHVPGAYLVIDFNGSLEILYANTEMGALLGYESGEQLMRLNSDGFKSQIAEQDRERVSTEIYEHLQAKEDNFALVCRVTTATGSALAVNADVRMASGTLYLLVKAAENSLS